MCTYACPISAPTINPDRHVAINCDLCNGDPKCVKLCPTEALEYVREDVAGLAQKRAGIEKLSEVLRAVKGELVSKVVI